MAILVSANKISMSFGAKQLFQKLSFVVSDDDRIGLIGPNGAGKSTLLKLISAQLKPEFGEIANRKGLRVAYLDQDPHLPENLTADEYLMSQLTDEEDWAQIARMAEWLEQIEYGERSNQKLGQLSGGWKKKISLIGALVSAPDLLLLDEPTNHLDVESILWLEELLTQTRCGLLMITHDRAFLQNTCTRIIELDSRHVDGLLNVHGDYSHYLTVRENVILAQERREQVLKNNLRRESEWLARGAKARQTKQVARINRADELKNTVENLEQRNTIKLSELEFQGSEKQTKKLVDAKNISKSFNGNPLFKDLSVLITPKTRLGLMGTNGSGKTTLIRILLGEQLPDSGTVQTAEKIEVAYLQQDRSQLVLKDSVLKNVCPEGDYVRYQGEYLHIRSYLDRFLFSGPIVDMPVSKLSGGERCRILLAQLMLKEAQLLILDEPTNDLDVPTQNVLEECLRDFPGGVILVSHDRFFMDQVCNQVLCIDAVHSTVGHEWFSDLFQWEAWLKAQKANPNPHGMVTHSTDPNGELSKEASSSLSESSKQANSIFTPNDNSNVNTKLKKLSFKEEKELSEIEANIALIENENSELELKIGTGRMSATELNAATTKLSANQTKIETFFQRWTELDHRKTK